MSTVNAQPAAILLQRVVFLPVLIVVLRLLLLDTWQELSGLHQEQSYRAQRIADFLAISASQEGSTGQDFSIFQ
ncbi:MAG: hypothetical protein VXW65_13740, partial [Pseudomonadota bacterium]|nr:hypothetical protein [Pseudomonadota bacterium]